MNSESNLEIKHLNNSNQIIDKFFKLLEKIEKGLFINN